jgi:hypothetical protein
MRGHTPGLDYLWYLAPRLFMFSISSLIRVLLQWLQDQGLVYTSVKDHYLPTLALSP